MRWKEARKSRNVEDRRGRGGGGRRGGGKMVGGGLGTIVVALVAIFLFNQDPATVLEQTLQQQGGGSLEAGSYTPSSPEEQEMADFTSTVLAYTEDVWKEIYPVAAQHYGGQPNYQDPTLVLFSGLVESACGRAQASVGPFYCPADQQVYIDLAFYHELRRRFSAPGDFAQAYVISHEVGHHVQNLLGISGKVQQAKQRARSKEEANRLSVMLELQADYFAGVWAHHGQRKWQFLENGDIEEGIRAAKGVGDDMIQKQTQGYVVEEAFTHGSAEQRTRWFALGLKSGDPREHNPFNVPYDQL